MRHFKLPLIVTGIVFVLAIGLGIAGVTMIHRSAESNRVKKARAEMLGSGVAFGVCFVIFPFWILAASKFGKERRAAREAARQADSAQE